MTTTLLRFLAAAALVGSTLLASPHATAQAAPTPMPGDTRLVVFQYDKNNTYTVLARPNALTDIVLHPDERLVTLAVGDTVQWITAKADGHVFIKPIKPDLYTSAVIVTDKRDYQLVLRSSPEEGKWYQRISWEYPELIVFAEQSRAQAQLQRDLERRRLDNITVAPNFNVEQINFRYRVSGEGAIRPMQVFDDGKFTYFRMDRRTDQEWPAVFILDDKDKPALANFVVKGEYLIVQRMASAFLLKLGDLEARVESENRRSGWAAFWDTKSVN